MKMRIAIADDYAPFREHFSDWLKCLEYDVIIKAQNGKELLDSLRDLQIVPDVCIIDGNMPVMNGIETTRQVKSMYPSIVVIVFSLNTRKPINSDAMEARADYFILKENSQDLKNVLAAISARIFQNI